MSEVYPTTNEAGSAVLRSPTTRDSRLKWASCRCGSRWTGLKPAHCPTCHLTFTSVSGFDLHRRGGVCLDPTEIGLELKTRHGWTGYGAPSGDWYLESETEEGE